MPVNPEKALRPKLICSALEAVAATWGVAFSCGFSDPQIVSAILFVCFFLLFGALCVDRSNPVFRRSLCLAALFAVLFFLGGTRFTLLPDSVGDRLKVFLAPACLFVPFFRLLNALFSYLNRLPAAEVGAKVNTTRIFWLSFCIILLCYLPYFLAYYPGTACPDAIWQIEQAQGLTAYSNHHPWLHTLLIQLSCTVGIKLFGTVNSAFALCIMMQLIVMAFVLAYTVSVLYSLHPKPRFLVLLLVFYALFPVNAWFSVSLWKDTLFSLAALMLAVSLFRLTTSNQAPTVFRWAGLFLWSLLFCLLRSNGYYAFLVSAPFLVIGLKRYIKIALPVLAGVIVAAALFRGPVMRAYHVSQPDTVESLSVPLQQLAYVVAENGTVTAPQRPLLENVFDSSQVRDAYIDCISDNIKNLSRHTGNWDEILARPVEYFKLWLEIGLQNPLLYIDAYTSLMKGYMTPNTFYWVYYTTIKENNLGLHAVPLLGEPVKGLIASVSGYLRSLPLVGLLFSPGTFVWLLLTFAFTARLRRQSLLICLPALMLVLTCLIASPISLEYRYIYPLVLSAPFYAGLVLYAPPKQT